MLVVRPRAQAGAWVDALAALGVAARALPLIEILPAPAPAQVESVFTHMAQRAQAAAVTPLASAAAPATDAPLLVFVSANAVHGLFASTAAIRGAGPPAWPEQAWAAATGPGTVAALRAAGVPAERIVAPPADTAQFDSEALWTALAGWGWAGRPVWIVRGNGGRDWLGQQLREAGAAVQVVQAYGRSAPVLSDADRALLAEALAEPARWTWLFSSAEAIGHLAALAPSARWGAGRALASHPRIAERARSLGFGVVDLVAPSPAAVAAALSPS